ncbi:Netrin-3 [Goodea atripinnis]|uniref:Netrin-3 n=1 Tax=Goodea atripinnis TaxID=208336 RepID=A0ABV0PNL2_9TELE
MRLIWRTFLNPCGQPYSCGEQHGGASRDQIYHMTQFPLLYAAPKHILILFSDDAMHGSDTCLSQTMQNSSYCKPVKGNLKINMKKYCKKDYAVQVNVLDMEMVGDWAKFSVSIVSVYKSRGEPLKRGDNILWVHMKDLACKCPKIQMSKRFLVMGGTEGGTGPVVGPGVGPGGGVSSPGTERVGLVADKNSLVIQWRDVWTRRLRKFQRKEKKGKCSKA